MVEYWLFGDLGDAKYESGDFRLSQKCKTTLILPEMQKTASKASMFVLFFLPNYANFYS